MTDARTFEPDKVAAYFRNASFAENVISREQLDAYGSYDAAAKALGMPQLYLTTHVSVDTGYPFVEAGHA